MMEDVFIYGKDPTEHWERVYQVLDKIHKSGMTLKKEKCEFGLTEVKFLGHIVSAEGIKLDPSKVSAICTMEPPTCQREAKRFMGMVNYLNKFSSKLAGLCVFLFMMLQAVNLTGIGVQTSRVLLKVSNLSFPWLLCYVHLIVVVNTGFLLMLLEKHLVLFCFN